VRRHMATARGRLNVGQSRGETGFWGRQRAYAEQRTGNVAIDPAFDAGELRPETTTQSILDVMPRGATAKVVLDRLEVCWKERLCNVHRRLQPELTRRRGTSREDTRRASRPRPWRGSPGRPLHHRVLSGLRRLLQRFFRPTPGGGPRTLARALLESFCAARGHTQRHGEHGLPTFASSCSAVVEDPPGEPPAEGSPWRLSGLGGPRALAQSLPNLASKPVRSGPLVSTPTPRKDCENWAPPARVERTTFGLGKQRNWRLLRADLSIIPIAYV
jgi:hypothetical protein